MVRCVQDYSYSSAQPNFPLTGGGYYNTSAFQSVPNIEGFKVSAIDQRAVNSTGIAVGTLWVEQVAAANSGDALYIPSATANAAIPVLKYGVLVGIPIPNLPLTSSTVVLGKSTGQNQIFLQQIGSCQALCTTGANAIAVGTLLVADGANNLTAPNGLVTAPSAGSATPYGTTGAATVTYQIYARNAFGLDSPASANVTTTTANATLSATNGIVVAGTIPAGTSQVVIVRTAGGPSQGVVGIVNVPTTATAYSFNDFGVSAGGAYVAPTTPTFAAGQVLAVSKGTLAASTATPTLVLVDMGGY